MFSLVKPFSVNVIVRTQLSIFFRKNKTKQFSVFYKSWEAENKKSFSLNIQLSEPSLFLSLCRRSEASLHVSETLQCAGGGRLNDSDLPQRR